MASARIGDYLFFDYITPPDDYISMVVGHKGTADYSFNTNLIGVFFGLAPQFNTGPVRWIPFGFAFKPLNKIKKQFNATDFNTGRSALISNSGEGAAVAGLGIEVVYIPLGLSFGYVPSIPGDSGPADVKSSVYSFKWTKKWGGEKEE